MMQNVYFGCAAVGGAILAVQTIGTLFGIGGHEHADVGLDDLHDHEPGHVDADAFVKILTFKSLVAFITFFGLVGLACEQGGIQPGSTFVLALVAGGAALYGVAWLMKGFSKLQSRGNVNIKNAVGLSGKVYLRVPRHGEGVGKVTVAVQGRTLELKAVTGGAEIPTGAPVKIVAAREPDTLEVVPLLDAPA